MDVLTASFLSGAALRRRSVSAAVRGTVLDLPIAPPSLLADWRREIAEHLRLQPGDIEAMRWARTRLRWREHRRCLEAAGRWMQALNLPGLLDCSELALMASRGTPYHHDGALYADAAFCNVFLSEDSGTDLHFPLSGVRIALLRGSAVVFDPCQPHAIIKRGAHGFAADDFAPATMQPQVFLTWEMPIEREDLARTLGIGFDLPAPAASSQQEAGVWHNGAPIQLCPASGQLLDPA